MHWNTEAKGIGMMVIIMNQVHTQLSSKTMISASLMEVGLLPLKALLQCKANCSQLVQGAG